MTRNPRSKEQSRPAGAGFSSLFRALFPGAPVPSVAPRATLSGATLSRTTPTRTPFFGAALPRALLSGVLLFATGGCGPDAPRALVLADGTGVVHSVGVNDRALFFQQKTGRQVRVLTVPAEQAVLLAGRGEADVAVVPMDTPLDKFLAREDGTIAGVFTHGGDRMKVLEVNAKQHPKVDPKGAHDLASAMIAP